MNVFVTGSTGYIGNAVVRELFKAGHNVTGLVRSKEKGDELKDLGIHTLLGNLSDTDLLKKAASENQAVIHLAFDIETEGVATDRLAIDSFISASKDSSVTECLIYTSGVMVLGNTGDEPADEEASTDNAADIVKWRPDHENIVLNAATTSLATAVIRPGMVYGGKSGIIAQIFQAEHGVPTYIGDGKNRWGLIHLNDLAVLYRLVIENQARGIFHGVDGEAIKVSQIAGVASKAAGFGGKTASMPIKEARKIMGPYADALCQDQVISAPHSHEIGWNPDRTSFLENARAAYDEWKN